MPRYLLCALLSFGLLPTASPAHATTQGTPPPAENQRAIAQSRAFIRDTMRVLGIPGVAICVAREERLLWSDVFGLADVEHHVLATRHTEWPVGSVSKALTSAALGVLVEQGRLNLDIPIQQYAPTFPTKPWPITTRELAGHLAGIRDYRPGEFESTTHYPSLLAGLSIFAGDSLLFEPGTQFFYSSYGWNLLGTIIENAAGEPFLDFMERRVFLPAGMTHTVADDPHRPGGSRARRYVHPDSTSRSVLAPYVDNSYKWPSGGFLSTADDLCRFGNALLAGRVLQPATVRLLWTSQVTSHRDSTGYGLGWYVVRDKAARQLVYHTGEALGGSALLAVFPGEQLVLAILMNSDRDFIPEAGRIASWFLAQ